MQRYDLFTAEVAGVLPPVRCRSKEQALKFLLEPLCEAWTDSDNKTIIRARFDDAGLQLVGTLCHEIVEIEDPDEAAKRGLRIALPGGPKAYLKKYVAVRTEKPVPTPPLHIWANGWELVELTDELASNFKSQAETEAASLEARAAKLRTGISTGKTVKIS